MKKLILISLLLASPAWAADKPVDTNAKILADMGTRISRLEENNRQLVGQIEELQHQLEVQAKKQTELQKKLIANGQNEVVKQQNQYQQFVTPIEPAEEPAEEPDVEAEEPKVEEEKIEPQSGKAPESANLSNDKDFNRAFTLLGKLEYEKSTKEFKKFIAEKPKSPLVGEAYYWLGEISFMNEDYNNSAINYLKGYKQDKAGRKAPESMIKLAASLKELGKKEEACKNYSRFATEFPTAHKTLKMEAVAAQKDLKCSKG